MVEATASTSETMWVERITTRPCCHLGQQVAEAHPLLRVEPHRRLVDDHQLRIPQEGLGDPTRCRMPPENVPAAVGGAVQVDQLEEGPQPPVEIAPESP